MSFFLRQFAPCLAVLLLAVLVTACGETTTAPTATTRPSPTATTATTAAPATPTAAPPTATPQPTTAAPTATSLPATATAASTLAPTLRAADLQKAVPVVGELPAPPEGRKLNFTIDMVKAVQKRLGSRTAGLDLSGLIVGAYAASGQPVDTFDYYRAVMRARGWTESHDYNNLYGIYFVKDSQVAIVTAVGVPDDTTITFLAGLVPEVKGQIKSGDVLVLLGQGPSAAFELVKK